MLEPTKPADPEFLERQRLIQKTALVCSIAAVLTSPALVGAGFALVAVGLVVWGRRADTPRALAVSTVLLSALAVCVSALSLVFYLAVAEHAGDLIAQLEQPAKARQAASQWEGRMAPELAFTTPDGEPASLSQFRGRRVLLDFWATWCPPCVKQVPHLIALTEEADPSDFVVIGLSHEDAATIRSFANEHEINYLLGDFQRTQTAAPYSEITSIPTALFIDRHGVIQKIVTGYRPLADTRALAFAPDSTPAELTAALEGALEAAQPSLGGEGEGAVGVGK